VIKEIYADGFKSLNEFRFALKPGLNILIGPNGAGKTNIISLFEFIGLLQEKNLSEAFGLLGGAGAIFRKRGSNDFSKIISVVIQGECRNSTENSTEFLGYEYSFEIAMSESRDHIFYKNQSIKIKVQNELPETPETPETPWDVEISREYHNAKDNPPLITRSKRPFKIKNRLPSKYPEEFLNAFFGNEDSIINLLNSSYEGLNNISRDLKGGTFYNLVPSNIKIPEDTAKTPGIRKDGSGLYVTLHTLEKGRASSRKRFILSHFSDRDISIFSFGKTLKELIPYYKLANEAIKNIEVIHDPFDNKLQVKISLEEEDSAPDSVLPLSAMSDGVLKWMSLITALFTNKNLFSIEEPENYFHPLMQQEFLNIIRETLTSEERAVLLSTHSETILNNATPDEVVLITFKKGKTSASRPQNIDLLKKEISETGFGLGYFYIAGSLQNE
jgi:predicted ATPase